MFEFRWKKLRIQDEPPPYAVPVREQIGIISYQVLQERHLEGRIDASGAINILPGPEWTEWEDVGFGA